MRYCLMVALIFIVTCKAFAVTGSKTQEVLLLHSYHKGYKWTDDMSLAIDESFANRENVEIMSLYMDIKRIDTPAYLDALARLYKEQFPNRTFDLIMAADNAALDFVLMHHSTVFHNAPIVFLGINGFHPRLLRGLNHKITGVVEEVDIASTLELMLAMNGGLQTIFVLNDQSETGLAVKHELEKVIPYYSSRLNFEYVDNLDILAIKERVSTLNPENTAILFLLLFKDSTGKYFTYKESLQEVRAVSSVPIFGVWDFYLGHGVVGGKMTSAKAQGEAASKMALEILDGKSPDEIPILDTSPNVYLFDHNELARFGLKIPLHIGFHEIHNKPFSFYETYKSLVWSLVLLFLAGTAVTFVLATNVILRRKSEKELKSQLMFITTLLDTMKNPIFYKDVLGRYMGCNQAFSTLLKLPKWEIKGKTIYDLFPSAWAKEHALKDEMLLKYPNASSVDEATLHLPGRPMQHFVLHKATYSNADASVGGVVCIMDNITERIQQKQFLIQQSKLAEMGEMIAAIAHQWNEPLVELSAIVQDMEMAYYNEELTDDVVKAYVKDSMLQIQYMSKTLKDFRNFLKPSTQKKSFSVRTALSEITELIGRHVFYSNINLFVNFKPEFGDIMVYGYENEFKQVLLNIINNAKKKIINTYKGTDKVGIITINVYRNEDTTVIQIIDDAGEIHPSIINHVFDPYFTTTPGGTGLGLYMAKVIIEDKMQGRISVANGENSAIFIVEVPNCERVEKAPKVQGISTEEHLM
ncbi:PAS domain-containing protein [Sulfurospirillum sp. T05]|uniref:PAS domain-containing protein n=1 Tax=Sulfurospirillum tamanense TaxID=2813362 RepID=A0ABS2WPR3_9BACT|nr:sensor histidine kinase [Sulfurospirillum tamanensis]MBN2963625.1 PAS domain-containing protein [Sulfurospirillum tamanensis]